MKKETAPPSPASDLAQLQLQNAQLVQALHNARLQLTMEIETRTALAERLARRVIAEQDYRAPEEAAAPKPEAE